MTVSQNKKSKDKRYRVDSVPIFSELEAVMPDVQAEEDAIDRLLIDTGFDLNQAGELQPSRAAKIGDIEPHASPNRLEPKLIARKIEPRLKASDFESEDFVVLKSPTVEPEPDEEPLSIGATNAEIEADVKIRPEPILAGEISESLADLPTGEDPCRDDLLEVPAIRPEYECRGHAMNLHADTEQIPDTTSMNDAESMPSALGRRFLEQEAIIRRQEQTIERLVAKTRNSAVLSSAALLAGIIAIALALILATPEKPGQQPVAGLSLPKREEPHTGTGGNDRVSRNVLGKNDLPSEPRSQSSKIGSKNSSVPAALAGSSLSSPDLADNPERPANHSATATSSPQWFVNLFSFRRRSDAVGQAAELIRKGIRSEIIEVEINGDTWYRLRVSGFIGKEQAAEYAEKIKKSLQLNSIWIAQN
ncbi:MAG: SPOR domain-containing protein [Gammaproteobacteria bacterium]